MPGSSLEALRTLLGLHQRLLRHRPRLADLVGGFEGLIGKPHGCFEQTSSATYPNVMVLHYMQRTDTVTPEIEMQAREYISQGYQRLLTFEVDGGGFALWRGGRQPHPWTSVYASHFLVEARQAGYATDPQLEARALDHLRGLVRGLLGSMGAETVAAVERVMQAAGVEPVSAK